MTYTEFLKAVDDPIDAGPIGRYGCDRTIETIREIAGLSRAEFARAYHLPLRSLENWESTGANSRTAPPYLADLLAFAVIIGGQTDE